MQERPCLRQVQQAMENLQLVFGEEVPQPVAVHVTRWTEVSGGASTARLAGGPVCSISSSPCSHGGQNTTCLTGLAPGSQSSALVLCH